MTKKIVAFHNFSKNPISERLVPPKCRKFLETRRA